MTLKGTVWASIGPSPMLEGTLSANGTTTAIAINPNNSNIIYQGTAGGGVWRSVDGGVTWSALFDRQFSLGIGETGALAIDPNNSNIIYVGTSSRTIRGAAFEPIQQLFQSFPGGDGLFKSIDGGSSWIQLGSGFPDENTGNASQFIGQWINVVIVDPADSNTVYVASTGGVFVSVDGGQNWLTGNNVVGDALSLVLDPSTPATSRIIYAGLSGVGVLQSTDGGQNWTQILNNTTPPVAAAMTAGGFTSINKVIVAIAPPTLPANPNGIQVLYVALQGNKTFGQPDVIGLFLSTNQGGSWTQQPATGIPSVTFNGYTFNMGIDPASPGDGVNDIIYFGTVDQAKSINSGNSFSDITGMPRAIHADTHSLAFFPGPTPSLVYFGTDGGLYRSTDGGSIWTSLSAGGLQTGLFYNIDVKPDTTASVTVGGLQDNGVQTNTGTSSLAWRFGRGGDGFDVAFDTGSPPQVYASANASGPPNTVVRRSNDDGATFPTISDVTPWGTTGEGAAPAFLAPVSTDPSTATNVYVSGSNNLWQSTNGGTNWRILLGPSGAFGSTGNVDVARTNSNNVVIAVNQQVFVSTNALAAIVTFTDITLNLPSRNVIRAVFDPNDPAVIYAVLGGFNGGGLGQSGHVFRTTVNSTSWTDISPPLDLPFSAIALDGTDIPTPIYVGTDFGVLRSLDGGSSWSVLDDIHFPHGAPITDLVLKQNSGVLSAATYGRGVFQFVRPTGPVIAVNPQQGLAFGDIGTGPAYLTLEVFNVGAADLIIDSVQRLMGSSGFTVLAAPGTPLTIIPGNHVDFTIRYIPTATRCTQETATIRISSNDPSARFVDMLATGTGSVPITQIKAHIETGNQDPDSNTRVFLGFEGKHGREFRMRTTDDANPFRESTALDIVFGSGANVKDENINDPTQPQMDQNRITGAYIRIEPGQEQPWKIASAQVFINGSGTPMFSLKLPNIVLEEDAGERVSLG
jgi:hypothetical protein